MTEPYYTDEAVTLYHGDNRELLAQLPPNSVEACVTDPPYELGFMGRKWDSNGIAYDKWLWAEVWRVLKPGGHLLAFGGTRTWHRLAVAIEDAGFEVRDSIAWVYGSGFPKSLDVSKAIDKAAGHRRGRAGEKIGQSGSLENPHYERTVKGDPVTNMAKEWQGWGTALKPAFEPIVVARKPLIGTVAENVQRFGTGAINVDGCRIRLPDGRGREQQQQGRYTADMGDVPIIGTDNRSSVYGVDLGRWPANVILDESQAAELDRQSGVTEARQSGWSKSGSKAGSNTSMSGDNYARDAKPDSFTDLGGGASRFFYVPKANSTERPREGDTAHPTVKPLDLMRYLVRLVTPPGGTVLEPFAGSGTTAEACIVEGFKCIAMELTPEYLALIVQRITKPIEPVMF